MDYQTKITERLVNLKQGILGADTGTGKTKMLLDALTVAGIKDAVVVCPAFLRTNWIVEREKWGCPANLEVISYDKLARGGEKLFTNKGVSALILDEAHYIRNKTASRTKAVLNLVKAKRPSFLWFATATPIVKSAENLYPMLVMLDGLKGKTPVRIKEYRDKFCLRKANRFTYDGWEYYGCTEVFNPYVRQNYNLITLDKEEVLNLPDKVYETIYIDTAPKTYLQKSNLTVDDVVKKLEDGGGTGDHIASIRRELGIEKVASSVSIIKDFAEMGESYVVWGHHREVLQQLSTELNIPVITGETSLKERDSLIAKFQNKEVQGLVCSIGAMGVGVTLTQASTMFWVEKPYLYSELKQCEDRLHRIGQKNSIKIISLTAKKTLDEAIQSVLHLRKKLHSEFILKETKHG